MKKKVYFIKMMAILLIIIPGIESCVKNSKEIQAEAAGDKVEASNENIKKETKQQSDRETETELQAVVGETEGKDFLLYEELQAENIYIEDFEIGPLQNTNSSDPVVAAIFNVASSFIENLIEGRIESDLISSDKQDFVKRNLADVVESGVLTGYRLGLIRTGEEPVNAPVRFESGNTYFKGTVYFVREGQWKIYDLHMNFDLIDEE